MAGSSIDTGPGGFDVNGQTYAFDVGLSEAEGGSQGPYTPVIDISEGYVDADGKPKDLTTKTKTTLAQYLSDQTSGKGTATPIANDYPVDPTYASTATQTKSGNPALQTPGAGPPVNSTSFAADTNLSSLSDAFTKLSDLRKGKGDQRSTDGNDLLPGIPGDSTYTAYEGSLLGVGPSVPPKPMKGHPDTSKIIQPYVSAVLRSNRFFDAASAFLPVSGGPTGEAGFNPGLTQQTKFGAYDPLAQTVSAEQLATIGPLLTMRAGKELLSAQAGVNPNSAAAMAAALLPGIAQLGVTKVDASVLYASDILTGLTTDALKNSFVLDVGSSSWGALNNTDDPFSGTDAVGMALLSIALIAGLELLIDGISFLLGLITSQAKKPSHDAQGRYSLGEYYSGEKQARKAASGGIGGAVAAIGSLNFGALLGIQPTNYPFSQALSTGANAFFGLPTDAGIGAQLLASVASSIDSPGFNVVVARAIIRSGITIVDQTKKIGGNAVSGISQTLALIDTIRGSKLISACNVFAMLGDSILVLPKSWVDSDAQGGLKISQVDQLDNSLANGVNKNRLKGSLKLSWASNRAPANLLLPASILDPSISAAGLGQYDALLGTKSDQLSRVSSVVLTDATTSRIKTEDAAKFEAQLDAEYVPFYFHDVRTNEMIAFHAFLASLTDDYTAAYEKTEGYGRVEAVKTYRGTERRIGLSFYVVATSTHDFDEMWIKINKLVTLVYPQFTKGVQLSSGDGSSYKFTQPFSQLIGASPLVRLRLGDLLKSNYSRFGLARLFGLGNADFTINSVKADKPAIDDGVLVKYASALRNALGTPTGETYHIAPGSYPFIDPTLVGIGPKSPQTPGSSTGPKFAPVFVPHSALAGMFIVEAQSVDPSSSGDTAHVAAGSTQLVCKVRINDDPQFQASFSRALAGITNEFGNSQKPLQNFLGGTYSIPISALTATAKTKQKIFSRVAPKAAGSTFASELSGFLSPDDGPSSNAIAKSFRDTGGKGLAGFIETINFDWFDKVTWETSPDRTAPKMCKVTITFSPIHDITPGLDHLGFNRAPVYPVGILAQQTDSTSKGDT